MIFKNLFRVSTIVNQLNKRGYFSSRISSLFVSNFDKYCAKFKKDSEGGNVYEASSINKLLEDFTQLTSSIKDVEKELSNEGQADKELMSLMKDEKVELESKQTEVVDQLLNEIYDYGQLKDDNGIPDSSSVLFEINPGVGGKEAMLFANELSQMYHNYFYYKSWNLQDVECDEQNNYLRNYHAKVSGRHAWGFMKFEAGVHRVQRVPETEARGRVHTSTVQIACIPITDDSQIEMHG